MPESIVTIIVPCYNEEKILDTTIPRLRAILLQACKDHLIDCASTLLLVDDGSTDRSWEIITHFVNKYREVTGLKLSRNFGHPHALIAGIESARPYSDCVITINANLQAGDQVIPEFLKKYHEGCDFVRGVRNRRMIRRARPIFYQTMQKLGIHLESNPTDLYLLSRRALKEMNAFQDENIFLSDLYPLLGLQSADVSYTPKKRVTNSSKSRHFKGFHFFIDRIASSPFAPIRMVTYLGIGAIGIGILNGCHILMEQGFDYLSAGWNPIILSIWILGGMQLIVIGMIGESIRKRYRKARRWLRHMDKKLLLHRAEKLEKYKKMKKTAY